MAASIYVVENAHSPSPVLHAQWCVNTGATTVVVGSFVGCFMAMALSKTLYQNIQPCPYCCGALVVTSSIRSKSTGVEGSINN